MYGAIFGDIIGSRFEFDRGGHTKAFELFTKENSLTDDTVMTIAVGEALMKAGKEASLDTIREEVIDSMRNWGHRYPHAGYGGRFWGWLFDGREPKPYGSYGNGSAMRVSAAGWLYDTIERTREVAVATAEVTHNHPEGIKGAECTAAVIFLARKHWSKEDIREYVVKEFGYDLSESLEELRKRHEHVESCQDSLPKALQSFFLGNCYEDIVRNAVSLGGDTDTIAAIAGAMGEAYYGIPILIFADGMGYLPQDILEILNQFSQLRDSEGGGAEENPALANNHLIREAVCFAHYDTVATGMKLLLTILYNRMREAGEVIAPMCDKYHAIEEETLENITVGQPFSFDREIRLTLDKIVDAEQKIWVPLYTDEEELDKGQTTAIRMNVRIETILREAVEYEESQGLVINPFGEALLVPKELLQLLMEAYDRDKEEAED